jgi:hypothetical protein
MLNKQELEESFNALLQQGGTVDTIVPVIGNIADFAPCAENELYIGEVSVRVAKGSTSGYVKLTSEDDDIPTTIQIGSEPKFLGLQIFDRFTVVDAIALFNGYKVTVTPSNNGGGN